MKKTIDGGRLKIDLMEAKRKMVELKEQLNNQNTGLGNGNAIGSPTEEIPQNKCSCCSASKNV